MHSRDILRKAKGDHLDRVCSDQKVLKAIRQGEAGPFYRRPLVSKLTQRRLSGSSPFRSDGPHDIHVGGWSM
jgi:hypothetical protein